ncbi:hypothetical protein ACIB24_01295 [Spongisporangium articulatum]|uniref:DUF5666 domain-containing protein n=1 Tax=Spongisporangium articulatum TaxID=3362603 RepID=A0ABW8AHQ6_9ACTN
MTQQYEVHEVDHGRPVQPTYHEVEPIDPLDEELLAEEAKRRPGKLTLALAAGIVLVGAFAGGVLVQKHYGDSGSSALPGGANFANRAGVEGFPSGGFPGGGEGFPGGAAVTGTGGGTGAGTSTGGSSTSSTPAVVGTLTKVSGKSLTVKNFGGKYVKVAMTDDTTVTMPASLSKLVQGTTVSVVGTTGDDGTVKATAVTATK